MSRYERSIDQESTNRELHNRLRKLELELKRLINCGYCRYHRGENATRKPPRSDKGKNHRREG